MGHRRRATLTSITAYRNYRSGQPGDIDYSPVDILYRSPINNGVERRFKTFSQELRLQGKAFNDKLDWLVGAYFADEDLTGHRQSALRHPIWPLRDLPDHLRQRPRRLLLPTPGCISPTGRAGGQRRLAPGIAVAVRRQPVRRSARPSTGSKSVNDRGSTLDRYHQDSRNWALFTHNIFHITDKLALTLGLRYTNEKKDFDATFGNDNTACVAQQAALLPFLANPGLARRSPAA